jgi:hypothetical protein
MAPEHESRTRVLYDHENDEPRRRHAVADWGVGEDIFDRMPSRRFTRADRRAEHRDEGRRFERHDTPGVSRTIVIERAAPADGAPRERDESTPRGREDAAQPGWLEDEAPPRERAQAAGEPPPPAPEPDPMAVEPPPGRRTVVISGHPERLPMARPARPPRTAVERVGASPDRIVAYAVALGFVLVLIAVLTTGQ